MKRFSYAKYSSCMVKTGRVPKYWASTVDGNIVGDDGYIIGINTDGEDIDGQYQVVDDWCVISRGDDYE